MANFGIFSWIRPVIVFVIGFAIATPSTGRAG